MSVNITMPQLGLTMTEGTVGAWLKKPGESVKKDDVVLTVSTDKVDMDVESPADGTLEEILIEAGETVPVGTILAYLVTPGGDHSKVDAKEVKSQGISLTVKPPVETTSGVLTDEEIHRSAVLSSEVRQEERIIASPRAKKMAVDLQVDLTKVKGSGPQNLIVAEDVERAAAAQPKSRDSIDPDTRRRQIIADRMVESV